MHSNKKLNLKNTEMDLQPNIVKKLDYLFLFINFGDIIPIRSI